MRTIARSRLRILAAALACGINAWPAGAAAHAFPEHEEPAVGSVIRTAPRQIRIWFDSRIEREFSVVAVKDGDGNQVSGKPAVDPRSFRLLEADLPPLAPGAYHVYWTAVSWDGHHTKGDYIFTVKP